MNRRSERGSAAIEAVVVAPVLVLAICLVIFGGRVALSRQAVQDIAADAARAASLERTTTRARGAAERAVADGLAQRLPCVRHQLDLDLGGFAKPVGTPGSVAVALTCDLATAELGLPGLPDITVSASALNPLDTFRERANR